MNPPTLHGINVDEHSQGFIDEVLKVVDTMGVTPREMEMLSPYHLKDVFKGGLRNGGMKDPKQKI